jgi:hypothetical protein
MTETTYQGWKNYQTWCIALWLDNNQGTYTLMRENATEAIHYVFYEEKPKELNDEIRKDFIEKASFKLSSMIKEYVEENNPLSEENSLYSDLLSAAISQADFVEISEAYLTDDLVSEAIDGWDFD